MHRTERLTNIDMVGGWVGGSLRKYYHFVAPSCKLELARFSALLRIQDGAECGNMTKVSASHLVSVATYNPERFYSRSGQNPEPKVCKIQRKSGVKNAKSGHK